MFRVGDKILIDDNSSYPLCGNANCYKKQIAYFSVSSLRSDGKVSTYEGYDSKNNRLMSCCGCLRDHFKPYNQGEKIMNKELTKDLRLGQKLDSMDVLVPFIAGAHPEEKPGTKYVLIRDLDGFKKMTIVELQRNDNSSCPFFYYNEQRQNNICPDWKDLAPIPESLVKPSKPSIVLAKTVYSDGVEVSAEEVKFDGKTYQREELAKLVARYQEVLRRPMAQVPEKVEAPKRVRPSRAKKPAAATATPKA